ncbi:chromosome partitioning protein ParA [Psychroserpens sp.]|uniref:chromosome partitioning protein ParA n=1 Tax=Psychroserpens sp. TaxID=2020870 RepID=UPI001B2646C0|nr:chromosome partitioning protein ParA [Psychroserpens sp.]MBO6606591.1 chromosome partitioning protein ParA [Psychroserpens sp.]MBO6632668.1 chromosome partitioning protein ParA [Psychroserpens sp.]MBO6653295.1 chromosome partitioning protein ParA [Psychroserpens sp.]MBO6680678.1 chromosome partitioning protein ParA [Psychroserpens sp.]MBO6750364.1 chromosome partitioning protein ParA [Psychroserpens sp.]
MENSNSSGIGLKIALGILLALFLGTAFYTSKLYKEKQENEVVLTREKEQVMADLSAMAKQYDVAIADNEVTNQKLVDARDRIQGLMDSLKISQNSVNSLWKYKKRYLKLQKEMDVILAENDQLKIENSLLAASLDSTNVQLAERTVFTDSLLVQNTQLAEVVENAAVLQTVKLKGDGVIERSSGKLIPTERAKRSDKLRICFTVAKNALVGAGDKELFVQVLDPLNNVLGANEQITFEEGQVLNYSLISKFNYENRSLDICEYVTPNDKFQKGRYTINVFNQNQLVSTSEFTMK